MATFSVSTESAPAPEYVELSNESEGKPITLILSNLTDEPAKNADGTPMVELDEDGNEHPVFVSQTISKEFSTNLVKFSNTLTHLIDDIDDVDEMPVPIDVVAKNIETLMDKIVKFCDNYKDVNFPLKPRIVELKNPDGKPVMIPVLDENGRTKRDENQTEIMEVKKITEYIPTNNTVDDWNRKMQDSDDKYLSQFDKKFLEDIVNVSNEEETFDLIRLLNHLDIYPMLDLVMTLIADEIKKQPAEVQIELFERIEHPEYFTKNGKGERLPDDKVASIKRAQRDVKKAYKAIEKGEAKIKELTDGLETAHKELDEASEDKVDEKKEALQKAQDALDKATADLSNAHKNVEPMEKALSSILKNIEEEKSSDETTPMEVEESK